MQFNVHRLLSVDHQSVVSVRLVTTMSLNHYKSISVKDVCSTLKAIRLCLNGRNQQVDGKPGLAKKFFQIVNNGTMLAPREYIDNEFDPYPAVCNCMGSKLACGPVISASDCRYQDERLKSPWDRYNFCPNDSLVSTLLTYSTLRVNLDLQLPYLCKIHLKIHILNELRKAKYTTQNSCKQSHWFIITLLCGLAM